MKLRKTLCAVTAVAFSVCAITATVSAAPLVEASSDAKADYEMIADEYMDYTKVASIEAVITAEGYVRGSIGITNLDGDWIAASVQETSASTSTWKLDGLNGLLAKTGEPVVYVQVWDALDGAYSIDSVTLYDADGKVITPSDTPVERPDIKLPDAVREDIDNDAFKFPGKIDIEKAVGEDFGTIGAIDFTFKWNGENAWNGAAAAYGFEYEDGTYESWKSFEMGNCMENRSDYWVEVGPGEGFYRFDFSENPIVGLTTIGLSGEISGYAMLDFSMWGQYGEEPSNPQLSNVTFYNADGEVLASLDYETDYDTAPETDETDDTDDTDDTDEADGASSDEDADAADNSSDTSTASDNKGNPDTGAAGAAAFLGLAAAAGGVAVISRKKR